MKTNRIKLSTLSFGLPHPLLPCSALFLSIFPADYARTSSVARSAFSRQIWLFHLRDPIENIALSGFDLHSIFFHYNSLEFSLFYII